MASFSDGTHMPLATSDIIQLKIGKLGLLYGFNNFLLSCLKTNTVTQKLLLAQNKYFSTLIEDDYSGCSAFGFNTG